MKSKVNFVGIIRLSLLSIRILSEIAVKIVLIWSLYVTFSSINTRQKLLAVSLSIAMPSMNSSGNYMGMKDFSEVGRKIVHLVLSTLKESLFALKPGRDTF